MHYRISTKPDYCQQSQMLEYQKKHAGFVKSQAFSDNSWRVLISSFVKQINN